MKLSLSVLFAALSLSLFACAGEPAEEEPAAAEEPAEESEDSESSSSSSSKSASSPSTESASDEPASGDASADPADPTEPTPPTDPEPPPADPEPQPDVKGPDQTVTCTSSKNSHKSVSKVTFATWTSGKVTVSKLTINVNNNDNRNENDANVFVTMPGQGEKKILSTGDILKDATTVTVKLPANLELKAGAKMRVETNFDEPFFDAAASCTMTL